MRRLVLAALLISGIGCSDAAPPPRGVATRGGPANVETPPPPPAPATRRRPTQAPPIEIVPPAPIVVRETVEIPQAPVRDLGAELHAAFGDPASCFGELPPQLRVVSVDLSCTVHEDGVTSRCSTNASYATNESDLCLRRRSVGMRLPPDVPDAPRSVGTRLELRR